MTPAQLRTAGEVLFGPRWQTPLARALGVAPRTIRRWLRGTHRVPPMIPLALARLAIAEDKQ